MIINFFKRAMISILRSFKKSLLLMLLTVVLGTLVFGALSVEMAVVNTEAHLRQQMAPLVSFRQDFDALEDDFESSGLNWAAWDASRSHETLTAELVRQIGSLPYVSHFEYSVYIGMMSDTLQAYQFGAEEAGGSVIGGRMLADGLSWIELRGTSEAELLQVSQGVIEIVEGASFTEDDLVHLSDVTPIIVSRGFAALNQLAIGSTFSLTESILFPAYESRGDRRQELREEHIFAQESFAFEVIGMFDVVAEIDFNDTSDQGYLARSLASNAVRFIHVPNVAIEHMLRFQFDAWRDMERELNLVEENEVDLNQGHHGEVSSVMLLQDAFMLEPFEATVEALLPDFWVIHTLANDFEAISTSMFALQEMARWTLWGSIGATLLILSLLITLFLRDRHHELGVYLALGEKKFNMISQILTEMGAVILTGMTWAVLTGHIISRFMTQMLIHREFSQVSRQGALDWNNPLIQMGFTQIPTVADVREVLDVSLRVEIVAVFYLIGVIAIILATLFPLCYVMLSKPKKFLR
ncbi:MAG: FtsX-like permease family protein [Defluviitaleaceae bacterium]|nr:FtsX-like permease family protein [Defluviitaleaceae bacterium]